jgi:aryl-alcohol dehydrogenase-like predicted oxidoreductase
VNYRYNLRLRKKVSEIGFGAWQLGGQGATFQMSKEEGVLLVKEAVKEGINFFDTAPNYANGMSEIILGEALKDVREEVVINTKVGHGPNDIWEFSKEGIRQSVERSLEKLQTTYIDSVILHNPQRYLLERPNELYDELEELRKENKIRLFGVSIDSLDELQVVLDSGVDIDTVEIMFNMIHQEPRYLFDQCLERNILMIIKVPLDSGWLTGKYNATSTFTDIRSRWSNDEIKRRATIVDDLKKITKTNDMVQDALRYILHFDAVTTVIPGIKNLFHLHANINASSSRLTKETVKSINEYYEKSIKNQTIPW